ncbi:MAG TPA: hypothetical protein VG873_10980 [Burkholderiales bacterium]|nr:hypothetical protein [Burkholderiales bacterium]
MATTETCGVEAGLFKKKPCGQTAVAHCLNCEMPLCTQHAIAQVNDLGKRTGKFMCKECTAALKDQEKTLAAVAKSQQEKKKMETAKAAMDAINNPAPVKKPAAPAAPASPAPAGKAGEAPKKDDDGALEFTPTKK